jgi:hypothetical protein
MSFVANSSKLAHGPRCFEIPRFFIDFTIRNDEIVSSRSVDKRKNMITDHVAGKNIRDELLTRVF